MVADIARSDPLVEIPGEEAMELEGREKGDDTGEELTDKSDAEEWEIMEEVHEEEFVKTERIVTTDDVVIPQNLPDPERHLDTPPSVVESSLAEEELVQRVAVEEREELRDDGFTIISRQTTMYHIRTEFGSPRFRGDEPRKVEKLLGTEVEEQITELAPGVKLPYDDDADVETMWDESEDCLPGGTWLKKKTTRITVYPPPSTTKTAVTADATTMDHSPEGICYQPSGMEDCDAAGLVDSGYRDETPHDLSEEFSKSDLHVMQQLESGLYDLEQQHDRSDLAVNEPTIDLVPEITDDLVVKEGTDLTRLSLLCKRYNYFVLNIRQGLHVDF